MLDTKRIMRQLARDKKKQITITAPEPSFPMPPIIPMPPVKSIREESEILNAHEMERYLTTFLQQARDAERRHTEAIADEQYPNSALQDYLHVLEFAPSQITDFSFVFTKMSELRQMRRTAKQELEVTQLWKDWAVEHKKSIDKLENVLGQMRKVLARQPNDFYSFKTDVFGEKGSILVPDEKKEKEGNEE